MAVNKHFDYGHKGTQRLYEDLAIEAIQTFGQDVYYLPRELVNSDPVFLDDVPSRFSSAYKIEMYVENTDGFEGEGDLFTKFGIELRDQATFILARKRWKSMIGDKLASRNFRPREGDLIHLPLSDSIFEILKVETETPFYQLKHLPVFRLQCELFAYNDEDLDTGIREIDDVEAEHAYAYKIILDSAGGGFEAGESVSQDVMRGEVSRISDSDGVYSIDVVHSGPTSGGFGEWNTEDILTGGSSNAAATPTLVIELQQIQTDAQNVIFDSFADDFIDFSENNPFSEER